MFDPRGFMRPFAHRSSAGHRAVHGDRCGRGNVRQLRTMAQAALVESDGDLLMLDRPLDGMATHGQPERRSGMYEEAKRDFDRRFHAALHVRFHGEPFADREGRGQSARDGEGGAARARPTPRVSAVAGLGGIGEAPVSVRGRGSVTEGPRSVPVHRAPPRRAALSVSALSGASGTRTKRAPSVPFRPSLELTSRASRGALEQLLAALLGHLPSHRPPLQVADLGIALGIVWSDAMLPKHFATALQGREDVGTEPFGRQTPRIESVEPDGPPPPDLRVECERHRFKGNSVARGRLVVSLLELVEHVRRNDPSSWLRGGHQAYALELAQTASRANRAWCPSASLASS